MYVLIHVFECFRYCLPLHSHFFNDYLLKIIERDLLADLLKMLLLLIFLAEVLLVLRIALRVVPEVETRALMDAVAEPRAKILIVDPALLVLVPLLHQFVDVFVVRVQVAEVAEEVFARDEAIVVLVHEQECLAHRVEVAAEFLLQQFLYHVEALQGPLERRGIVHSLYHELLSKFVLSLNRRHEVRLELGVGILVVGVAQMREECPLEALVVDDEILRLAPGICSRREVGGVDEKQLNVLLGDLVRVCLMIEVVEHPLHRNYILKVVDADQSLAAHVHGSERVVTVAVNVE